MSNHLLAVGHKPVGHKLADHKLAGHKLVDRMVVVVVVVVAVVVVALVDYHRKTVPPLVEHKPLALHIAPAGHTLSRQKTNNKMVKKIAKTKQ